MLLRTIFSFPRTFSPSTSSFPVTFRSLASGASSDQMAYVLREDANKTRYMIARLPIKEAEAMVVKMKSSGHKQTYWIEEDRGQTPPPSLPHRPPEQKEPIQNPIAARDPFAARLIDAKRGPGKKLF